jgi:hypothetical protein
MPMSMVSCKVLSRRFPGETNENHEKHHRRYPGQDLNTGHLKYDGGVLTTLSKIRLKFVVT